MAAAVATVRRPVEQLALDLPLAPTATVVRRRVQTTVAPRFFEQLALFAPSVMRRSTVRRVTRFVDAGRIPIVPAPCDSVTRRWTPPAHPRAFDELPYLADTATRRFVRGHPGGASLSEIAEAIGWTKQGVNGVVERAFAKICKLALQDEATMQWLVDAFGGSEATLAGLVRARAANRSRSIGSGSC